MKPYTHKGGGPKRILMIKGHSAGIGDILRHDGNPALTEGQHLGQHKRLIQYGKCRKEKGDRHLFSSTRSEPGGQTSAGNRRPIRTARGARLHLTTCTSLIFPSPGIDGRTFETGTLADGRSFYAMKLMSGARLDRYAADTHRCGPRSAPACRPGCRPRARRRRRRGTAACRRAPTLGRLLRLLCRPRRLFVGSGLEPAVPSCVTCDSYLWCCWRS